MKRATPRPRPTLQRTRAVARAAPRVARTALPVARTALPAVVRPARRGEVDQSRTVLLDVSPNPYVDYMRALTEEGGILITYKDIDTRLRYTLLRLLMWLVATCWGGWVIFDYMPARNGWLNIVSLVAVAIVNWLIVRKPVELYRSIEFRPDCMILEENEVFWRNNMGVMWPTFRAAADGSQVLCGIYGTRFVEYLTVRKFDEFDRTPQVMAAHIQNAMQQLWSWPYQY